jgi:Protein of unknown function (DUF3037)
VSRRVVYYSIVQVVPDPARGERLNVGALAWDPETDSGSARFASYGRRLRALGVANLSAVDEFRDWLSDALVAPTDRLFFAGTRAADSRWNLEAMQAATQWGGIIQLSDVRPARANSATELANTVYERAVHVGRARRPAPSTQKAAQKAEVREAVADELRRAIYRRFPQATGLAHPISVETRVRVPGKKKPHQFDVAIVNGSVAGAMITPNFENRKTAEVVRDLEAATWGVIDVRDAERGVRFAVASPAPTTDDQVREAFDVLVAEGASPFIGDPSLWGKWAEGVAAAVVGDDR